MKADAQKLYDALKRIVAYMPPEKLHKQAGKLYGLDGEEAIEMAYDNVLQEAKNAIKGVRRPESAAKPAEPTQGDAK